ncbi:MAG: UDP-N-acetylglucosamine pyrophosphorylase [Oscillospiraceae bacterium]|nr:UDP-N-acetylglucosamine pyrophosphorylase [Oscillospiraceae bacterium]
MDLLRIDKLFLSDRTLAWKHLTQFSWPWEALPEIGNILQQISSELNTEEYHKGENNVWIHKTATIAPTAYIGSSVIIGAGTEIRHCAFIRGNALIGNGAVVGNSTEIKNSILFDEVQTPHFNYIGDSILGYKSHLGAGAITSNVKSDRTLVLVSCGQKRIETGLKKFGAILGDHVEVGCNTVLNPGSVIGPGASVYPLSFVRGFVPADSIYKNQGEVVVRDRV